MSYRDLRWMASAFEYAADGGQPRSDVRNRIFSGWRSNTRRDVSAVDRYTANPDLIREFMRKTAHVAERTGCHVHDVREVASRVVRYTGHLTLFYLDSACETFSSDTVWEYVVAANNDNAYAREVLQSDAGERMRDQFDIGTYATDDAEERWGSRDEISMCSHCGEGVLGEDAERVYSSTDLDEWDTYHPSCARSSGNVGRCGISGYLYSIRSQSTVCVDDEDVWQEYCEEQELIEYDEEQDEWYRAGYRPQRSRLAGYHEVRRSWDETPCRVNGHVGVELELGFPDENRDEFLEAFTDHGRFTDGRPFIIERDGSLDGIPDGCELISSPLPLYEGYQAAGSPWRSVLGDLYEYGAAGWRYRRLAGLHVNLCVTGEPDEVVLKYAMFINAAHAMSCFIAGRDVIYGRREELRGGYDSYPRATWEAPTRAALQDVYKRGKYAAVNRRDSNCLETRIFGSNLRYEGFMAAVEYCAAVMTYVRLVDVWQVVSPIAAAEFRCWLGTQTKRFPNLIARLGIVQHDPSRAVPSTAKLVPVRAVA